MGGEEVGNPSTVASTDDGVDMISTPTVELIGTSLVTIRYEWIVCRKTSEL